MKSKFKINGLDCANCANELERAIQKLDGIKSANINFMAQKMELEYDEDIKEKIIFLFMVASSVFSCGMCPQFVE